MHSELFSRMNQLEVEFHTEIEKTRNRENEILSRIDRMNKTSGSVTISMILYHLNPKAGLRSKVVLENVRGRQDPADTYFKVITGFFLDFKPLKDEFMKSTNSRLFEVTELENRSNSVLEEINASNVENAKKIDFIEEFEATTEQKISGQESEIRILSKMLNSKLVSPP